MKNTTLIGIVLGTAALIFSFGTDGGSLDVLFLWPAITIVVVGTLAATFAGTSLRRFKQIPSLIGKSFSSGEIDPTEVKIHIYRLSEIRAKDGELKMEDYIKRIALDKPQSYLSKLTLAIVDGAEEEDIIRLAQFDSEEFEEDRSQEIELFKKMGGFAPTMGIIGTVMGLIATMASVGGSPDELIRHIATAFVATLWGIFIANLIFLPIADKLETKLSEELKLRNVIEKGMLALARGDTPIKVRTLMGGRDLTTTTIK